MNASELYKYIINHYEDSLSSIEYNYQFAQKNFNLDIMMEKTLKNIYKKQVMDCSKLVKLYPTYKRQSITFVRNESIHMNDIKQLQQQFILEQNKNHIEKEDINLLAQKFHDLETQYKNLESIYIGIINSNSWKITKPLRDFKNHSKTKDL